MTLAQQIQTLQGRGLMIADTNKAEQALDEQGKPYYMVKNSWGESGQYRGIWYMSRDYMMLNTVYLFLNRKALPAA